MKITINKDVSKKLSMVKGYFHCSDSTAILILYKIADLKYGKNK